MSAEDMRGIITLLETLDQDKWQNAQYPNQDPDPNSKGGLIYSGPRAGLVMTQIAVKAFKGESPGGTHSGVTDKLEKIAGSGRMTSMQYYYNHSLRAFLFFARLKPGMNQSSDPGGIFMIAADPAVWVSFRNLLGSLAKRQIPKWDRDDQIAELKRAKGFLSEWTHPDRTAEDYRGRIHHGDELHKDFGNAMEEWFDELIYEIENNDPNITTASKTDVVSELIPDHSSDRIVVERALDHWLREYLDAIKKPDKAELTKFFEERMEITLFPKGAR